MNDINKALSVLGTLETKLTDNRICYNQCCKAIAIQVIEMNVFCCCFFNF